MNYVVSEAYQRELGTECRDCGCLKTTGNALLHKTTGNALLHSRCYRERELDTLWRAPAGPALSYDGKTWEPVLG